MKVIRNAQIEIVTRKELKQGDEILFMNRRCIVKEIPFLSKEVHFVSATDDIFDETRDFINWYKILSCTEINICISCSHQIPDDESSDFCNKCKEELEMMEKGYSEEERKAEEIK